MDAALILPLAALVLLAGVGLWIWSLIDVLKRPDTQWENAGQTKIVWVVLIVVLGLLGTLLYLLIARPILKRFQYKVTPTDNFDPTAFGVPEGGIAYQGDGFRPTSG